MVSSAISRQIACSTELCPLAAKVPKLKVTGNSMKDIQQETERDALVSCINILWKYPHIRTGCVGYLQRAVEDMDQAALGAEYFDKDVTTIAKLEEQWCVDFICARTGWSQSELGTAKVLDPSIVVCVMEFLLAANRTLRLSAACKRKIVCMKALDDRCAVVNARARLLKAEPLIIQGQINWHIFVYEPEFHGGSDIATHLKHRPTGVVVDLPNDVEIDKDFCLEQNHHDLFACFTKGLHHKYKCHVFFGPSEGPHFHKHWNGMPKEWEVVIQAVVKKQEATDEDGKSGNNAGASPSSKDEFITPLKEMQREKLKAARAKHQENLESSAKKRRRVSLVDVPEQPGSFDLEVGAIAED